MRYITSIFIFSGTVFIVFWMLGLMGQTHRASALATITVNSTADATDVNPGDGICETAVDNNICTLRAAIQETNALAGADEIILPAGTYNLTIFGTNENNAVTGDLDVTGALTITGDAAASTIIDANGIDRVFDIMTNDFALSNTTVRGGVVNSATGGGINFLSGSLMIDSSVITDNTAVGGGGLAFLGSGQVMITNTIVSENDAGGAPGGGLYINAAIANIDNSTIGNNTAVQGGGVVINTGVLTMTNGLVEGNTAVTIGGGLFNGANSRIISSTIQDNVANDALLNSDSGGGGIFNIPSGSLTLEQSTVHNNKIAFDEGGGIYNLGKLVLTGSQVTNNFAYLGGGIFNSTGSFTTTNTNVANNEAVFMGGGIWNESNGFIDESSVQDNLASDEWQGSTGGGGGILNSGNLTITQSTISGNNVRYYDGGGLFNRGAVSLENTQFNQNSANGTGGAIYSELGSMMGEDITIDQNNAGDGAGFFVITTTLTLTNSTLSRNTGGYGTSGLLTAWGSGSLTNVTVSENQAGSGGEAIFIYEQDYSIIHSTIVSNTGSDGAIYINDSISTLTIENSIVAYNPGGNCSGFSPVSAGHNLESANDCGFNDPSDLINEAPLLGHLQDNGGDMLTHALLPGSPAIDAGDSSLPFDQRGVSRPQGSAADIGAVEAIQYVLTVDKVGTGTGTITTAPAGISCGSTCSDTFVSGTVVTLTAAAEPNSIFLGWVGEGCSGTDSCVVTMDAAKLLTATFNSDYKIYLPIILKP